MALTYSLRGITDLETGDHLCSLYETKEEHQALLTPFLRQGLERDEKVLYIVDAHTAETVLSYLQDDGLEVEPYLTSGQLSILAVDEAYIREGVFDPDGMIALLRTETEQALAEGYSALRVTVEMSWALRGLPGSERLIECEARLNEFLLGSKCLALCQYDRRRFDPAVLSDVLCTHPIAVIDTAVYDNPRYIPPAEFLGHDLPAAKLHHWLDSLAERNRADEAYQTLVEHSLQGLVIVQDFHIVFANTAFAEISGYTIEELMSLSPEEVWAMTHPEDQALVWGRFRDRLKGKLVPSHYEYRGIRKDGAVRWLEMFASYIEYRGKPAVQGAIIDITERKQAEEELRKHRDHLEELVEEHTANLTRANEQLQREITERKQMEEALRRYADEQTALYTITSAVATSLDPNELFSSVLDVVLPALDADVGWVMLPGLTLDDPPHIVAWRGVPESFVVAEMATLLSACSICAPLLASGDAQAEPILIAGCPRLPPEVLADVNLYSHVCIPLSAGAKVLGILNIAWRAPRPYSESDRALLLTIGQQVGMALHNAQLYQSARQVDRLQVLNELDQALAATLDPEKVLEATLSQVATALDAPMGMLFVLPPQADTHLARTFTLAQGWIEVRVSEKDVQHLQALSRQLQDDRETISLSGDELAPFSGDRGLAQRWGPNSPAVPIWGDEGLVAVLVLGGRLDRPFTDEDWALAQAAAGRAGQAIQNAWLYQASQERLARLATLNAISAAVVSSLDLDTVLRQVLELTRQALDAAGGSILLSEPNTGGLVFELTLSDEGRALRGLYLGPGQGIAGWVAQHGQAVCVSDVRQDNRFYEGVDAAIGFETRSLLCAPLRHREKITGVIEIINKREGQFSDEDLSLLEAVSSIAAVAIENACLYTATRAQAEELVLLNEIGLALTSTLDYSEVVHVTLSQVQRLFQAEGVTLLQPDPQTGELYFVEAMFAGAPVEVPVRLQPGEGVAGWALEHRQPVLVGDAQTDPRFSVRVDQHLGFQTRALMAVPLLMQERAIGVIEVVSSEPEAYTLDELRTLQALASTLAVALENARLYDELKTLLRERERTQAQMIHSEKMAALGRLAASLAHEINNPLQSVVGCLGLAQERLSKGKDVSRYLQLALGEVERVARTVAQMRDLSRPRSREKESTDVNALLEQVLEFSRKQCQEGRVEVVWQPAADLPLLPLVTDQIKQVFLNLLLNAIEAIPGGGRLQVSTAYTDQPAGVRIEFTDSGVGIAPDVLLQIFEPFYSTRSEGMGLGLYVSYGIVERHGGHIEVESQVGQGSTFTVWLPAWTPSTGDPGPIEERRMIDGRAGAYPGGG